MSKGFQLPEGCTLEIKGICPKPIEEQISVDELFNMEEFQELDGSFSLDNFNFKPVEDYKDCINNLLNVEDIEEVALAYFCDDIPHSEWDKNEVSFGWIALWKDGSRTFEYEQSIIEKQGYGDLEYMVDIAEGLSEEWRNSNQSLKDFIKPYINFLRFKLIGAEN